MLRFFIFFMFPITSFAAKNSDFNYFEGLTSKIYHSIKLVCNYTLFTMDKQPVALYNIVTAVIFLVIGLKLARSLSLILKNKLLKVINIDPSVNDSLGKLFHYLFIILISLIVLDIAHVPLTVFTFIGGTLAISVGVGGQHLANNFVSGLVLMIERPLKINDIIEIENIMGRVISIDARSISIRTHANKVTFIPHSFLLQNTLTNWSMHDIIKLDTSLTITQSPSSPRIVEHILFEALHSYEPILSTPRPEILLSSFENNMLNFEINFFVNSKLLFKRRQIISEVNFLMEEKLREKGVLLAIPHRTLLAK